MKKRIFIFVLSLIPLLSLGQNVCVDSLLQKIDSIRSACEKLKDKEKVKGYEKALILQDSVYNLMADSIRYFSSFEKDAHTYQYFVCNDASIFLQKIVMNVFIFVKISISGNFLLQFNQSLKVILSIIQFIVEPFSI